MRVRIATASDAQRLVPLCIAHAAYEQADLPIPPSPEALAAALSGDAPLLKAWVAEVAGELMGYASGSPAFCTWTTSTYFVMDCLFIAEPYRGRGWGDALMTALQEAAQASGHSRIEWLTPPWNAAALGFYEKLGATRQDRVRLRLGLVGAGATGQSDRRAARSA